MAYRLMKCRAPLAGSSGFHDLLIWSQDRADFALRGTFRLGPDAEALFGSRPRNVLLLEVEPWLGS